MTSHHHHHNNYNWFGLHSLFQTTRLNPIDLVHISTVVLHQLILTGLLCDQSRPVVIGPSISPDWSFTILSKLKCVRY